MSFLVKVEGSESFEVAKECVRSVKVTTDIPLDSNARTKDVGATMVITWKDFSGFGRGILLTVPGSWHYGPLFRRRKRIVIGR